MNTPLESSIVRIYSNNGKVIGAGFLVSEKHVLTCAHVVASALGIPPTTSEMPTTEVGLDFPRVAPGQPLTARLVFWRPVHPNPSTSLEFEEDIAALELRSSPPDAAQHMQLVTAKDLWGHRFRVFGFPEGNPNGVWAYGALRGRLANDWVQLEAVQEVGYCLERGFSGTPVWDDKLQGVVGMAVAAEMNRPEVRAAFIIPTSLLVQACPKLSEQAISPCPYRGLNAFREDDARFFYGRELVTKQLVQAVQTKPLVAVTGASGSGKSSVVFAGLIPNLRREGGWLIAPFSPGDQPFSTLVAALIPLLEPQMSETERLLEIKKLAEALRQGSIALQDVAERIVQKNPSTRRLLLVADQFEELYTLCLQEEERLCFLDRLLEAVSARSQHNKLDFTLVIALRADFLNQAHRYRPFIDALQDSDLKLGFMTSQELQEAVEKPAHELRVRIEDGLTEHILSAVSKQPGDLPLLQFALTELWKKQRNGQLTHTAYNQIGGVERALAHYAEKVYNQWFNWKQQQQVQQILIQLVSPGHETEDTRRRATRAQVGEDNWALVTRLADARLVVSGRSEATGEETVEMAHEVLIRGWKRMSEWMEVHRKFRIWQEELRAAVRRWNTTNRDDGALLRGAPLAEAEESMALRPRFISPEEKNFIQASLKLREREHATHERLKQMKRVVVSGSLISLVIVGFLWQRAEQQRQIVLARDLVDRAELTMREQANLLQLSVLLTIEAMRRDPSMVTKGVLYDGLALLPRPQSSIKREGSVNDVAFSPDGKYLATASLDKTACVWETSSGKPIKLIKCMPHKGGVNDVAFSPDGKHLATASLDGTVRLWREWNTPSGKLIELMPHHKGGVNTVAFSPDKKHLATAGADGIVRVWNVTSGEQVRQMTLQAYVRTIDFSWDGKYLATASLDGTACVWETSSGKKIKCMHHNEGVNDVAFSPDGNNYLATASLDGTACVWAASSGKKIKCMSHKERVVAVTFSLDGKYLATASLDGTARVWEPTNGKQLFELKHGEPVTDVVFSPDNKYLATASSDNTGRVWAVTSKRHEFARMIHEEDVNAVAFSPPDSKYVATASLDRTARVWDIRSDRPVARIPYGENGNTVVFSQNGQRLATVSLDGTVGVWNATSGYEITSMKHEKPVIAMTFSDDKYLATVTVDGTASVWNVTNGKEPVEQYTVGENLPAVFSSNGKYLATVSSDGTIYVRSATSSEKQQTLKHKKHGELVGEPVRAMVFSADGKSLAVAGDSTISIWHEWKTTSDQKQLKLPNKTLVEAMVFSRNSEYLATASRDNTAYVWNTTSGEKLADLQHEGPVTAVVFSPDGISLATASGDNIVHVWREWQSSTKSVELPHGAPVTAVVFSLDGKYLATASRDNTARVWNATKGEKLVELQHEEPVMAVAFSPPPDDKYLATASEDGTAYVLLWEQEKLRTAACAHLTYNPLTQKEWSDYLPYLKRETCPSLLRGPDS